MIDSEPKRTADGYLAVMPRAARTGIQEYAGYELGFKDRDTIRVYRPEAEVFSKASLASFAHRPITVEHPPVMVDSTNWKQYGVGHIGDEVARDGEFVRVPMLVMDSNAIDQIEGGKVELSMGYSADIVVEDGVTPEGEPFDAYIKNIRGNHLAIVDAARGGAKLRVFDMKSTNGEIQMTTKKLIVDGISVEVPETAAQVIEKSIIDAKDKITDAEAKLADSQTKLATAETSLATAKEEVEALKGQLSDAKNPAAIDAAVKSRAELIDSAKKVLDSVVVEGKSNEEIKRQVVDSKLGDKSKEWTDAQVSASFDALAAVATTQSPTDPYATAVADGANTTNIADAEKSRIARDQELANAWKTPTSGAH
jgi:hypothetical protein